MRLPWEMTMRKRESVVYIEFQFHLDCAITSGNCACRWEWMTRRDRDFAFSLCSMNMDWLLESGSRWKSLALNYKNPERWLGKTTSSPPSSAVVTSTSRCSIESKIYSPKCRIPRRFSSASVWRLWFFSWWLWTETKSPSTDLRVAHLCRPVLTWCPIITSMLRPVLPPSWRHPQWLVFFSVWISFKLKILD